MGSRRRSRYHISLTERLLCDWKTSVTRCVLVFACVSVCAHLFVLSRPPSASDFRAVVVRQESSCWEILGPFGVLFHHCHLFCYRRTNEQIKQSSRLMRATLRVLPVLIISFSRSELRSMCFPPGFFYSANFPPTAILYLK